MKLIIQTLDKVPIDIILDVEKPSVMDLKTKINELKNHPIDKIRLFFQGVELDNTKSLCDYKIVASSTVTFLLQKLDPIKQEPIKQEEQHTDLPPLENVSYDALNTNLDQMIFNELGNINQLVTDMFPPTQNDYYPEQLGFTPEQKQDLKEIMDAGFGSYNDAVQYYVAFGYDKNATVNALLDNKFND